MTNSYITSGFCKHHRTGQWFQDVYYKTTNSSIDLCSFDMVCASSSSRNWISDSLGRGTRMANVEAIIIGQKDLRNFL